jgi:hypothetical protein
MGHIFKISNFFFNRKIRHVLREELKKPQKCKSFLFFDFEYSEILNALSLSEKDVKK